MQFSNFTISLFAFASLLLFALCHYFRVRGFSKNHLRIGRHTCIQSNERDITCVLLLVKVVWIVLLRISFCDCLCNFSIFNFILICFSQHFVVVNLCFNFLLFRNQHRVAVNLLAKKFISVFKWRLEESLSCDSNVWIQIIGFQHVKCNPLCIEARSNFYSMLQVKTIILHPTENS